MTADVLIRRLRLLGWRLGIAESVTGGEVSSSVVAIPGASEVLNGALVVYATELKHSLLGVDEQLLSRHGAVHPDVARQMADGVRAAVSVNSVSADMGIATTGVAGPLSPDGQPVGTVYIGVATPLGAFHRAFEFGGNRAEIRSQATHAALRVALRLTPAGE